MDDVSHALVGWALAEAGPDRKWGRPAVWVLILGSIVPDVDGVIAFWGRSAYLIHHRGFTHALIGWIPTALVVALPVWRLSGRKNFRALLGLSMAGVALHVLCDSINAWGVMPLYPFSLKRWQLDWVFILDGVFTAIPLVAVAAARWRKSPVPARAGLAALGAYVALCGIFHAMALRRVERRARDEGWTVADIAAVPMPPAATQWSGLVRDGDAVHQVCFGIFGSETRRDFAGLSDRDRRKLEASPDGRAFLWFARFPAVVRDGGRTVVYDARFTLPPGWPERKSFAVGWSGDEEARWIP